MKKKEIELSNENIKGLSRLIVGIFNCRYDCLKVAQLV